MIPTSIVALAIFLAAIVPGYVTIYLWSRTKTWKGLQNDLQTVIKSIALSAVIQVILLPYILIELYPVRGQLDGHPLRVAAWLVLATVVLPCLMGSVAARVGDFLFDPVLIVIPYEGRPRWRRYAQRLAGLLARPTTPPSVWDWVVEAKRIDGCYVVVTLKDGTRVAGTFGTSSFAPTTPERQGIFLEQEWLLNEQGDFSQPVSNTSGIMIPDLTEVRSIRLLRGEPANAETEASGHEGVNEGG